MNDDAFENILDECLDAVLSGKRTIADCMALYPDHADELKSALQIALLTTRLKKPEMQIASTRWKLACVGKRLRADARSCAPISDRWPAWPR
jgi:hypothetical protein